MTNTEFYSKYPLNTCIAVLFPCGPLTDDSLIMLQTFLLYVQQYLLLNTTLYEWVKQFSEDMKDHSGHVREKLLHSVNQDFKKAKYGYDQIGMNLFCITQ